MLRVLIVDDSSIARELLARVLETDTETHIVGVAKDGREAVELASQLRPDVITMDIHMPVMNGFQATKEIMIECPTPIVIVSSSTAVHEVEWAMQALQAGALTLHSKPPGPASPDFEHAARELVETVKAMADVKVMRHHRRAETPHSTPVTHTAKSSKHRIVAIAASTGGPPALNCLLGELPGDFPLPILLVQHIAEGFVEGFASWLNSSVSLSVKIAEDNEALVPATVYVAPHGVHLGVTRQARAVFSKDPPTDGFRPSATFLFRSCAHAFGDKALGVILTGMGRDGTEGLRALHQRGGCTIAQDEASSVVFGMPGAAVAEGLADAVVPIDRMAKHLLRLVLSGRSR